jgi:CRP-like cAMP-binding protein
MEQADARRSIETNTQRNRILNAMSNADLALLQPHLEKVTLKFGQSLQSPNKAITNLYIPESGIASVVVAANGAGRQAEIAIVGREGLIGLPVVHGTDKSPFDIFIQIEGDGHRIAAQKLGEAIDQSTTLLRCLLLYAHAFGIQVNYTALANARGYIRERLARWLLMMRDRLDTDEMILTHDFLALMLGVRRSRVSIALEVFESTGLVETARARVIVKDRAGLEACANGLYGPPEAEYERLFG